MIYSKYSLYIMGASTFLALLAWLCMRSNMSFLESKSVIFFMAYALIAIAVGFFEGNHLYAVVLMTFFITVEHMATEIFYGLLVFNFGYISQIFALCTSLFFILSLATQLGSLLGHIFLKTTLSSVYFASYKSIKPIKIDSKNYSLSQIILVGLTLICIVIGIAPDGYSMTGGMALIFVLGSGTLGFLKKDRFYTSLISAGAMTLCLVFFEYLKIPTYFIASPKNTWAVFTHFFFAASILAHTGFMLKSQFYFDIKNTSQSFQSARNIQYSLLFMIFSLIGMSMTTSIDIKFRELVLLGIGSFFGFYFGYREKTVLTFSMLLSAYMTASLTIPRYICGRMARKIEIDVSVLLLYILGFCISIFSIMLGRALKHCSQKYRMPHRRGTIKLK